MKFLHLQKHTDKKGFTLLEVLVAITILIFAITATFTAAQSGLNSSLESKNQVIAYYLAQEAIETIRNMRDTNSLAGNVWLKGIADLPGDPCYPGAKCQVDVSQSPAISACGAQCSNLRLDSVSGVYGTNGSWGSTNFKREITIAPVSCATQPYSNCNEVAITVNLTWARGSFVQTFTVRESMFNWQS